MSKRNFLMIGLLILSQFIFVGYGSTEKPPAIGFSYVPRYGSSENLQGKVLNADLEEFVVAVYIEVDGSWWTKPYWDSPVTKINDDGTWVCDITTGGVDETATRIVAYLIPSNYSPFLASGHLELSQEVEEKALAKAEARRTRSGELLITPIPQVKKDSEQIKTLGKLRGVCYGPFWDNENPDMGVFPLLEGLKTDIEFIPNISSVIRTYGCTNTLSSIPELCERVGIDCYVGAWLGKYKAENKKEIRGLIRIGLNTHQYFDNIEYKAVVERLNFAPGLDPTLFYSDPYLSLLLSHVKALVVGNEVLLREDMTEDELIFYIREVKKTGVPVTTADIWGVWLRHPRLGEEVDFLTVHIHPYWEGISIGDAASYVIQRWNDMKKRFPGKRIVIGETGWPSEGKIIGKAIASPENQARFFREFTQLAEKEEIEYFYFELFDEKWKDKFEGKVGTHWGIYNSDGSLKNHLKDLVPVPALEGISRPPRKVLPVIVKAPLVVYSDADSEKNGFEPSGWMGDIDCIEVDKTHEISPHSGKTCIRIIYKPGGFFSQGWSGIYWQYPLNNWGDYPGYELLKASKLSFWARGEKGGERAEFKVGGIKSWVKSNDDSFGPVSIGIVKLTSEWQKYIIDLKRENTSNVIGGFCWVTNHWQNPEGCTIYLDDIQFEP